MKDIPIDSSEHSYLYIWLIDQSEHSKHRLDLIIMSYTRYTCLAVLIPLTGFCCVRGSIISETIIKKEFKRKYISLITQRQFSLWQINRDGHMRRKCIINRANTMRAIIQKLAPNSVLIIVCSLVYLLHPKWSSKQTSANLGFFTKQYWSMENCI